MLSNHPEVYISGDSVGIPLARLCRRYLSNACKQTTGEQNAFLEHLLARSYKKRLLYLTEGAGPKAASETLQQYFLRAVQLFAERQGKKMWGDKTPELNFHIGEILQLFPHAKFIHLVRDPRPNARSLHKRQLYPLSLAAQHWYDINSLACAQRDLLGSERFMLLKYEDLVERPEESMQAVCSFLGLAFAEDVLDPGKNRSTRVADAYVAPVLSKERLISWREEMDEQEIKKVEKVAAGLMRDFGYEPLLVREGKPLSPFRIFLLRRKLMRKMLFTRKRFQMKNRKWTLEAIPLSRRLRNFLFGSLKQVFSGEFLRIFGYKD